MNGPSPLGSSGLPYVHRSFTLTGAVEEQRREYCLERVREERIPLAAARPLLPRRQAEERPEDDAPRLVYADAALPLASPRPARGRLAEAALITS